MNGLFEYWPSTLASLNTIIRNFDVVLAAGIALNRPRFSGDSITGEDVSHGKTELIFTRTT